MSKSKKGVGVFFITFMISFIILSCIFLLFFLYKHTTKTTIRGVEELPFEANYIADQEEDLNLLIIGCEKINMPPSLMLLLRYNAVEKEILLCALPPNALVTAGIDIKEDTLLGHYDYEGIHGGVNAVKSLLLTEIDRYVRFDRTGIANMIDLLGGIEFDVKQEITCKVGNIGEAAEDMEKAENGNAYIEKYSCGKQLLDGRRAAAILFNKDENNNVNTVLQSELAVSLFSQRFNSSLADKWTNFISAYFHNAQTNMNQYDFALRQKGTLQWLKTNNIKIRPVILPGEYNMDKTEFVPDPQSIQKLSGVFKNPEAD